MNIVIFTEGGEGIGVGHINRCFALYEKAEEKNINVSLVILAKKIEVPKGKSIYAENWQENIFVFEKYVQSAHCVIIDSYLCPLSFYQYVVEKNKRLVIFDDNARLAYPKKSILINASQSATDTMYTFRDTKKDLLGIQYIPLRSPFSSQRKKSISQTLKTVFIRSGGDDHWGMTEKIIQYLTSNYPNIHQHVIIGSTYKNREKIEQKYNAQITIYKDVDAHVMKNIMTQSDIAISACGQTLFELATTGVPIIGFGLVENQNTNIEYFQKNKIFLYAGFWNEHRLLENVDKHICTLQSPQIRKQFSQTGQAQIDGKGCERILTSITH